MMATLQGWVDYDRPMLPALNPDRRIGYFEGRVSRVVINPLRRILKTEIIVAGEDSSAVLIFGVSLCCAVEATGKFLTSGKGGHDANRRRFHAFLKRYMAPELRGKTIGGITYGEALWRHFRNGLAHGFTVRHGSFEGAPGGAYFRKRQIAAGENSLRRLTGATPSVFVPLSSENALRRRAGRSIFSSRRPPRPPTTFHVNQPRRALDANEITVIQ